MKKLIFFVENSSKAGFYLLLLAVTMLSFKSYSQSLYNLPAANWAAGNQIISFATGSPVVTNQPNINADICISDKNGIVQFYFGITAINGKRDIYNTNYQIISNGNNLDISVAPIIPISATKYLILSLKNSANPNVDSICTVIVDMSLNNGLGAVIQRNKGLFAVNYSLSMINYYSAFVKHANGRDWWLIFEEVYNYSPMVLHPRKFIKYLITENGIQPNPTTQTLITAVINDFNDALFSSFSPDGTKFFSCGISGKAQLFNFDRCSSLLSFDTDLSFLPPLQYEGYTGASFSYEGSKLYTADANGNNIYQFNLNAPNIAASKTLIFHNPYYNPSGGSLYNIGLPILAPDKKMYIFMGGGVNGPNGYISDNINTKVSVIQFPDNAGTSCGFSYQSFSLLETPSSSYCFYNTITNYDLGVLENSPCDTLGSTGVALPPTQTPLAIKKTGETTYQITTTKPTTLTLTDALGRQLRTIKAEAGNTTIDLNNYAQGVYFIAANGYKSVKLGR